MALLEREVRLVSREFDTEYYAIEYPDLTLSAEFLLEHFCRVGWMEGRNPNAYFDTVSYILTNGDVAEAEINPFYHYLKYGMAEGRKSVPAATPSVRATILFGQSIADWVCRVRPYIDETFYRTYLTPNQLEAVDCAAHFAYRGWQEGMSPSAEFNIRDWVAHYPDAKRFLVNPLLIKLEQDSGAFQPILRRPIASSEPGELPANLTEIPQPTQEESQKPDQEMRQLGLTDDQIALMRPEFSQSYYLSQNSDVVEAGVDPLMHYVMEGWKEGRNPNKEFDTAYYLLANEDVVAAGLHPFWHYLAEGRREGRRPCRPGGHKRRTIDAARAPEQRTEGYLPPENEKSLTDANLRKIRSALKHVNKGLVVSLSHDCYVRSVGGTQIFISDEEQKFRRGGYSYLHLSPMIPRLALAPNSADFGVRVVMDGVFIGAGTVASVLALLKATRDSKVQKPKLVVHSLLGFNRQVMLDLYNTLQPVESFYWLHDYSSICAGFNLLRNDLEFCNAPPVNSMVCRVCVCGPGRSAHLSEMSSIFAACNFTVLAPSQYTLDLWRAKSNLPSARSDVHWHWHLKEGLPPKGKRARRAAVRQIVVAFVGYPMPSKGWPAFAALVTQRHEDSRYKFLHLVTPGTPSLSEVETISTAVTSADRGATVGLLRANQVDIVLVLSTWPETFSFVAHEALVAGAAVVCMVDSGNVAVLVERTGRGSVIKDEADLLEYFSGSRAQTLIDTLAKRRLPILEIDDCGTTATAVNLPALVS